MSFERRLSSSLSHIELSLGAKELSLSCSEGEMLPMSARLKKVWSSLPDTYSALEPVHSNSSAISSLLESMLANFKLDF